MNPERASAHPAASAAPTPRRALPGRLVWVVALGVAGFVWVLDQATKLLAEWHLADDPVDLGALALTLVRNPNAAFGLPGFTGMFLIATVVVLALIARMLVTADRLSLALAYGLVAGGALGNATDRGLREPGFPDGAVVDFIDVGWFPVFNVADSAISVGAVLVIGLLLLSDRERAREDRARERHQSVRPDTVAPRQ